MAHGERNDGRTSFARLIAELENRRATAKGYSWLAAVIRLRVLQFCVGFSVLLFVISGLMLPILVILEWRPQFETQAVEAAISVLVAIGIAAIVVKMSFAFWGRGWP